MLVPTAEIVVEHRARKQPGDLEELASSISRHGLLHPIVVTSGKRLLCGARRLAACRDVLGWTEIEATVFDPADETDRLSVEYDENETARPFTLAEAYELGMAIRRAVGSRQGTRTDLGAEGQLRFLGSEVGSGLRTTAAIARRVGVGSRSAWERLDRVMRNGVPEVVAAMDSGEVKLTIADKIATLPPDEQPTGLVRAREAERKRALRPLTKSVKPKELEPDFSPREPIERPVVAGLERERLTRMQVALFSLWDISRQFGSGRDAADACRDAGIDPASLRLAPVLAFLEALRDGAVTRPDITDENVTDFAAAAAARRS